MPADSGEVPSHGRRARADRRRKVGLANAVASGRLACRVGILSESSLFAIRRLAADDWGAAAAAAAAAAERRRREEEARRGAAPDARAGTWLDTAGMTPAAHALLREAEADEAEERRQRLALPALKALRDDARTRNLRSLVMLHESMRDREAQMAFAAQQRAAEEAERRAEAELAARGKDEEERRNAQRRLDARARSVREKNECLQQVLYQINERRGERRENAAERAVVQRGAEEEAEEEREAQAEARARVEETAAANRAVARAPLSRRDRLAQRIADEVADRAARESQEARLDAAKQAQHDRLARRAARFDACKKACAVEHEAERDRTRHVARTQDVFVDGGTSFLAALAARGDAALKESAERRASAEAQLRRREALAEVPPEERPEVGGDGEPLPRGVRRAAATRGGFVDAAEERAYQAEMRTLPARERAERLEALRARRAEGERVERIQRLQAAEKRENERRAAEEEAEAHRRRVEAAEADDKRYAAYVKSQLPDDMHPYLYEKAMKLHS